MNWEAIGAIGGTLGALAVVLTLFYLAFQVRYARSAMEETRKFSQINISNAAFVTAQDARSRVILNEDVANIWRRGLEGEKLNEVDELRFSTLCEDQYYYFQNTWQNAQILQTNTHGIWEEMCVHLILTQPGFKRIWNELSSENSFLVSSYQQWTGSEPPFITSVEARLKKSVST